MREKILDGHKWQRAREAAKRIGGPKQNDVNFIMSIYKRLGGKVLSKSSEENMEEKETEKKETVDKEVDKKEDVDMLAMVPFHAVTNQKRLYDEKIDTVGKEVELKLERGY